MSLDAFDGLSGVGATYYTVDNGDAHTPRPIAAEQIDLAGHVGADR